MSSIKWYWWVLLGLAILLTIYVVIVSAKSNPKKVENKLIESDLNVSLVSDTDSYQRVGRIADATVVTVSTTNLQSGSVSLLNKPLTGANALVSIWTKAGPGYSACNSSISQTDLDNNYGGSTDNWIDEVCYGRVYTVK
jgi:hypothetical protein